MCIRDSTEELSDDENLPTRHWPVYGTMITGLQHIVEIVDDVASSREAREAASS